MAQVPISTPSDDDDVILRVHDYCGYLVDDSRLVQRVSAPVLYGPRWLAEEVKSLLEANRRLTVLQADGVYLDAYDAMGYTAADRNKTGELLDACVAGTAPHWLPIEVTSLIQCVHALAERLLRARMEIAPDELAAREAAFASARQRGILPPLAVPTDRVAKSAHESFKLMLQEYRRTERIAATVRRHIAHALGADVDSLLWTEIAELLPSVSLRANSRATVQSLQLAVSVPLQHDPAPTFDESFQQHAEPSVETHSCGLSNNEIPPESILCDNRNRRIFYDRQPLEISAQAPFEVLAALVDEFGSFVSYQALFTKLKPGEISDFVKEMQQAPQEVKDAMRQIRAALKSQGWPFQIENQSRRGYRIVST